MTISVATASDAYRLSNFGSDILWQAATGIGRWFVCTTLLRLIQAQLNVSVNSKQFSRRGNPELAVGSSNRATLDGRILQYCALMTSA